ncbi:ATP-binding protein [Paraflavitalea pollutisoli]|uniref:ATP/GTP-binding protein n=1 Tax=Paraflavitalea pollutisoli TaxID=3034143 RepID=UPI0023ECAF2F|nr:ATP-binding protein [Paraflavitalea sp. H1-2-19X]
MRIAITGAHGVGKTSLAERLQASLTGYDYVQEPFYDLEERGYVFAEEPTVDDFLVQLERSFKLLAKPEPNVIYDRCPLDLLAYIQALQGDDIVRQYYSRMEAAMAGIDLLVVVPIESPDRIKLPKEELPQLREDVNDILMEWLPDLVIDVMEVKGSLAEREQQVVGKISTLAI